MPSRTDETPDCVKILAADRQKGAAELGRAALDCLSDFARRSRIREAEEYRRALLSLARALQGLRPSMAALVNLVAQWREVVERVPSDLEQVRSTAIAAARDLSQASYGAAARIADQVARLMPYSATIFTHSYSSTLVTCFEKLTQRHIKAIITESRPGYEGRQLARALSKLKIPTRFITESQTALFMEDADAVLVGADTLLADGAVVNKAGTALLAMAADRAEVPFYVCSESFKLSRLETEGVRLEEMDGQELGLTALPFVTPRNFYFDITPPDLVTGWINEQGVQHYSA